MSELSSPTSTATGVNIFVNYLPLSASDEDLHNRFSTHGHVISAKVVRHLEGDNAGSSKGYGFVLMESDAAASGAIAGLDGVEWNSKRVAVRIADRLPGERAAEIAKRAEERKKKGIAHQQKAPGGRHQQQRSKKAAGVRGAARRTVIIRPVDSTCTLSKVCAVLEAYGPVEAAQLAPLEVRATFVNEVDAQLACNELNSSRVPQIASRSAIEVSVLAQPVVVVDDEAPSPHHSHRQQEQRLSDSMANAPSQHQMPTSTAAIANHQMPDAHPQQQQPAPRHNPYAPLQPVQQPPPQELVPCPPCPNGCPYCSRGTTVIMQNMPVEDAQCDIALRELLGRFGHWTYWECWGDGRAVATFPDPYSAREVVETLHETEQRVDFFDCRVGLPASEAAQFY